MNHKKVYIFLLLIISLALSFCVNKDRIQIPVKVKDVMDNSGSNQIEYMLTISYYMQEKDSLRLHAAYDFLSNVYERYYSTYLIFDDNNDIIDFNLKDYNTLKEVQFAIDSLTKEHNNIKFRNHYLGLDYYKITDEFCIKTIDSVYNQITKYKWSKNTSDSVLRNFILPYRTTNETFCDWRDTLQYLFMPKTKQLNTQTIDSIAKMVNQWVFDSIQHNTKYYFNPTDKGVLETLNDRQGRGEDIANLSTAILRSLLIGAGSDFAPVLPDSIGNMIWNFYIDEKGIVKKFNPLYPAGSSLGIPEKLPKVYRTRFQRSKIELIKVDTVSSNIPVLFQNLIFDDVTDEYMTTHTINISIPDGYQDHKLAYLCIWNGMEWKPVDWGIIKDQSAHFENMGTGLTYHPALYQNDSLILIDNPLFLKENGLLHKVDSQFIPDTTYSTLRLWDELTFYPKDSVVIY
jgi:hypothetical protein